MTEKKKDALEETPTLPPLPPNMFNQLREVGEVSEFSQVLNNFYTSDKNMDLKSEIHNPRAMATLDVFIAFCKSLGLDDYAHNWEIYRTTYVNTMVSFERGGRSEFVEIIKEFKEQLMEKEVAWD